MGTGAFACLRESEERFSDNDWKTDIQAYQWGLSLDRAYQWGLSLDRAIKFVFFDFDCPHLMPGQRD